MFTFPKAPASGEESVDIRSGSVLPPVGVQRLSAVRRPERGVSALRGSPGLAPAGASRGGRGLYHCRVTTIVAQGAT